MRRAAAFAGGLLLAAVLTLSAISALLEGMGTSQPLMLWMMRRDAPSASTGLPEADYAPVTRMITRYLAGAEPAFQYTRTDDGTPCFQGHEQRHMADVRGLFVLCRRVLLISFSLSALLLFMLTLCRAPGRAVGCGLLAGGGLLLAAAGVLIAWGAADFGSLFVLFHRLSFDNGLWVLNPATDLLIRLMPAAFFIHYALLLGVTVAAALVLILAVGAKMVRKRNNRGAT